LNSEISGDIERKAIETEGGDNGSFKAMVERRQKLESKGFGVNQYRDRRFRSNMEMHRIDVDTIIVFISAAESTGTTARRSSFLDMLTMFRKHQSNDAAQGKETVVMRLRRGRNEWTRLDLALTLNVGNNVEMSARLALLKCRLDEVCKLSLSFQRSVALRELTIEDGEALANDLLFGTRTSKQRLERLPEVMKRNAALSELKEKYEGFGPLIRRFLSGSLGLSREVETKLVCISAKEGKQLGKNGVMAVKSKKLASSGISQWKLQNTAVRELFEKYPVLETTFVELAHEVIRTAAWGLMWRVGTGSVLSFLDVITDIYVMLNFRAGGEEQRTYYHAMLASLCGCWGLHIIFTIMQNKGRGGSALAKELFWTVLFLKTPRDAFKVANGAKQEKGALMNPMTELSYSMGVELFSKGIPSVLIQVAAAVFRGGISPMRLMALVISIASCGFTSAQISYDFDTNPKKRAKNPDFYGYVPDGSHARTICFGSLIAISSSMLTIKTLGILLLSAVALEYVIYFFAIDIGSFLLIKIIRGDFSYYLRLEGIICVLVSLLMRVSEKVIHDFISVVQLRHPNQVGGAQSVSGQLTSVATLFIALHLAESTGKLGYEIGRLWLISCILTATALISYCVFFSNINEGYTHTFFTFETGGQATVRNFRALKDDGLRAAAVFKRNKNQWKSIYDEVKDWVWQKWPEWIEEKPAWFDDKMRHMIPEDMIPSSNAQKQIAAEGGKKIPRAASKVKKGKEQEITMFGRIQSQASGLLGGGNANKKANKVVPEGEDGWADEDVDELIESVRSGRFSGF